MTDLRLSVPTFWTMIAISALVQAANVTTAMIAATNLKECIFFAFDYITERPWLRSTGFWRVVSLVELFTLVPSPIFYSMHRRKLWIVVIITCSVQDFLNY